MSNYHGCKEEAIKLIFYMIDIYKTTETMPFEKVTNPMKSK